MKTLLISLFLIANFITIQAQSTIYGVEWDSVLDLSFFVSVNPNEGSIIRVDTLPGVEDEWTAQSTAILNETSGYYTFATYLNSTYTSSNLYNININTGAIVSNPTLSSPVRELNYDHVSGNYYALEFEDTTATPTGGMSSGNDNGDTTITGAGAVFTSGIYHSVSVNTTTGIVTRIANIAGVTGTSINNSAYNSSNKHFSFVDDNDLIYTIDVNDGSIVSNPSLSASIQELHYNKTSGVYYALENISNAYYLVTVNPTTGLVTQVGSVTGLNSIQICTSTLDIKNNIFSVTDNNDELFNINLSTATVNTTPQLNPNIIGLTIKAAAPITGINNPISGVKEVVKTNETISLEWVEKTKSQEISKKTLAYPNPVANQLTIEVSTTPTLLSIYNINGVLIKTETLHNMITKVNVEEFENGLYFFSLNSANKRETKRIFVQ